MWRSVLFRAVDALDLLDRGRFGDVKIEATGTCPAFVLFRAPTRQRHENDVGIRSTQAGGELEAVHARHAEIAESDVRLKARRDVERAAAIERDTGLVPIHFQQHRERFRGVAVVVHDQDAALLRSCTHEIERGNDRCGLLSRKRQSQQERAALVGSFARGARLAPMHVHESLDER